MPGTFFIIVAVLLRIFSNPFANAFQKQLTIKGVSPLRVNFYTYILLSILCLFFIPFISWPVLSREFWLYSIAGGIAGALGNAFLVKALQYGHLSVLGPINSYKSIVGMIIALFLLHEVPNAWGLIGIALIIYGSYFVLDTPEEKFGMKIFKRKEIQFRLLAMVLTGIEAVFDKKVILSSSVPISFISWCWFGAFFSFIILYTEKNKIQKSVSITEWKSIMLLLLIVVCVGTMQYTTNYTFARIPVGYALSLFQLSAIVSVWLGYKIFSEHGIMKKLLGSVIMIAGSVIIILFSK